MVYFVSEERRKGRGKRERKGRGRVEGEESGRKRGRGGRLLENESPTLLSS